MTPPQLTGVAPILLVKDVQASADYWRDKLGFSVTRMWGEPPKFCMPNRDGLTIMLSQVPNGFVIKPHWEVCPQLWNAYFWVDDVEALYQEFKRRGAIIDYDLDEKSYGVREFGIQDLDRHDIAFGQEIDD